MEHQCRSGRGAEQFHDVAGRAATERGRGHRPEPLDDDAAPPAQLAAHPVPTVPSPLRSPPRPDAAPQHGRRKDLVQHRINPSGV